MKKIKNSKWIKTLYEEYIKTKQQQYNTTFIYT